MSEVSQNPVIIASKHIRSVLSFLANPVEELAKWTIFVKELLAHNLERTIINGPVCQFLYLILCEDRFFCRLDLGCLPHPEVESVQRDWQLVVVHVHRIKSIVSIRKLNDGSIT